MAPKFEPPTQPAPAIAAAAVHVVQKGETLSSISRQYCGTAAGWRAIYEANRAAISDPNSLLVGTRLRIPPGAGSSGGGGVTAVAVQRPVLSAVTPRRRTHTVVKGDTLWDIAVKEYGDGTRAKDILKANQAKIRDARKLKPGLTLTIP
jgi:nucleoid-associated protein YgaU